MSAPKADALERGAWAAAAAGCVLRFVGLSTPFGPQELIGLRPSESPFLEIPGRLVRLVEAGDPPLFHLLLRAWRLAFGASAFSVHFLTALLGALGVAAAGWAGGKLGGRRAAALCAAVAALHPFALAYSQEARSYALLLPLELLALGALAAALDTDARRDWAAFAAATVASAWTHNLAIFFLAGAAAFVMVRRPSRRAAAAFAAAAAGWLAWLPFALAQSRTPTMPHVVSNLRPALSTLAGSAVTVEAGASGWSRPFLLALACAAAASALGLLARKGDRAKLAALASCAALSLALPAAASLFVPFFSPERHVAIAVPAVCLFWGLALASPGRGAAALALALLFAFTDLRYFATPKSVYPDVVRYVADHGKGGEALLVHPAYRREFLDALGLPPVPRAELCGQTPPPARVLTVFFRSRGHVEPTEPCDWSVLRARYRRVESETFGEGAVVTTWSLERRGYGR